jgi:chaperonin GroES
MAANPNLLQLSKSISFDSDTIKAPNLCEMFGKEDLDTLGQWVYQGYYRDRMSRSHWERRMTAGMELAIQLQKLKNFPWQNCSSVAFPLVTIGALQFSANSYTDVIQGSDIVQYKVVGDDKSGQLAKRADRVGRHMSWQMLEEDESWEEEHDRLLINLSVIGTAFVKTYLDSHLGYPVGEFVSAQDLVVDYFAKSLATCKRKTQRMALFRNDIHERILQGTFRDVREEEWFNSIPTLPEDRGEKDLRSGQSPIEPDADSPFPYLEQHRFLDLDHDGYAEPYTVTIEERSQCVCRIVARVSGDEAIEKNRKQVVKIQAAEHFTKYPFIPNPDGGFYDLGFGILLGPLNESVSTIINQIIDNGTLHNLSGGFIGRGMKIRGGNYTMSPFELKRVDSTGDDIRKNLVLFEPTQPPEMLFKLLMVLIEYANRIAGTTDTQIGENPGQNTPASTFQGMQEQGIKVYKWIFKRIWRAMKGEARLRYEINKRSLPVAKHYGPENSLIQREDYIGGSDQVVPVADPNLPSSVMRLQQAMFVAQRAMTVPGYDHEEVEKGVLRAARVGNIPRLYVGLEKAKPLPNPKTQVEELRFKGKQLDIEAKKQEWANHLMEERRLNNAKIMNLEAQAYKLIKDANTADVKNKLEALELALNTLKDYSAGLTERIGAMSSGDESSDGQPAGRGGMGGMEADGNDAGVLGNATAGAGATEGAAGNGRGAGSSVSGGNE